MGPKLIPFNAMRFHYKKKSPVETEDERSHEKTNYLLIWGLFLSLMVKGV